MGVRTNFGRFWRWEGAVSFQTMIIRSRFFVGITFRIRNARLPCHDEIQRKSKGQSSKIH